MVFRFCIGLIGVFTLISTYSFGQFYQGSQNEFGKNRVQYRDFLWQKYRFKEFDTYFYEGGQDLAKFTSKVVRKNMEEMEDLLDYSFSDKVQFIVYNTQSDFKQSNIGITGDDQFNIGGTTRIVGSKVFVYFEGDYIKFERQIKDGIARVLINSILYGGNWRDVIKSSTLLNLPDWYIEGLIMYASKDLERDTESMIRYGVLSGKYQKINRLENREANVAGYALWRYIALKYGENIIPNILYMSRVSRNVESGFLFVLGKSLDSIIKEFNAYYHGEYAVQSQIKREVDVDNLEIKSKKNRVYTQFEVSPDGRYAAYASNIMGQYRVYLYDTVKDKKKKLIKAEHKLNRITDYTFPIIAWHPSGRALSFVQEWRDRLILHTYNLDDKKHQKRDIFRLDKILSMEYSPNGQQIIFSGVNNGQTDLYLYYNIGNRQEQITNDVYGDFDPSFSKDGEQIIFTSNRPDDTLRTNVEDNIFRENRDVFAYNLKTRSPYLERITDTPALIELDPYQYDSVRYTFRARYEGTYNRYVATYDSTISRIDTTVHYRYYTVAQALTNYETNVLNYSAVPSSGAYGFMTFDDGDYKFYVGNFRDDNLDPAALKNPKFGSGDELGQLNLADDDDIITVPAIRIDQPGEEGAEENEIDIDRYQFEGEKDFSYERETIVITETQEEQSAEEQLAENSPLGISVLDSIALPGARNYNVNFTSDQIVTQLDNTFMTDFYQNLSSPDNVNPGLSGLISYGTTDLFEDYKIMGGFRLAGNLNSNTFMLMGEDLSKRIDKRLRITRFQERLRFEGFENYPIEAVTYSLAYRMSYPVNEVFSIRGSALYRFDQANALATDQLSSAIPPAYDHFAGLKAEFVFDNTLNMGLNLRRGMRWKVWGEYWQDPTDFGTDMITMGLDARHYLRLHRNLIWANRVGWSTALGARRVAFLLGGVDNWMFPRSDTSVPLDPEQPYAYQTIGTPMRGFFANSRNGNSFAVINSELRWPVFSYFFKQPLKSDFLENFQIIGFGDIGSAWTGPSPYSDENSFNNTITQTGNLTIEVRNNRDPVVYGYGFGLRSRLLGYFVRVDWAWGVDDGVVLDNVFYFSLALDF